MESETNTGVKTEAGRAKITVKRFVISGMNKISESLPPAGALCLVIEPVGDCYNGTVACSSATAYCRDGAWVYADVPTVIRFDPVYWVELSFDR